jgi:hypothetical protein
MWGAPSDERKGLPFTIAAGATDSRYIDSARTYRKQTLLQNTWRGPHTKYALLLGICA